MCVAVLSVRQAVLSVRMSVDEWTNMEGSASRPCHRNVIVSADMNQAWKTEKQGKATRPSPPPGQIIPISNRFGGRRVRASRGRAERAQEA